VIGVIALLWALLILRTKFPAIQSEHESQRENHGHLRELRHYPHFLLAVVAQFFYVGAQVGTWSYFITYVQEYAHQSEKIAGYILTGTLVAFGVGRFVSAWLMRFVQPSKLMAAYGLANVALVSIAVVKPGWIGVGCVFLTSFFMSLMFPTIFALGLKGLGPNTKLGGSLLVMAIVGGAVLTPIMGLISERAHSLALAYSVPLAAYMIITLYSLWGAHPRNVVQAE
jgi:MFS transporter, FHS family, L-fucose permease